MRTYGNCNTLSQQTCDNYTLAGEISTLAIGQVNSGGALNDLSTMSTDLIIGDLISGLMQQLPKVIAYGMQVAALAANSTLLNLVSKFLLLAVYAELTTPGPNPTQLVIPASDVVATQMPQETGSSECPSQIPNCSNCGGNTNPPTVPANSSGVCAGLPQLDGFPGGCRCVDPTEPPVNKPFENMQAVNEAQALLASIAGNKLALPCPKGGIFDDIETCKATCPGTCRPIQDRGCRGCLRVRDIEWQCIC